MKEISEDQFDDMMFCNERYKVVVEEHPIKTTRWKTRYEAVVHDKEEDKFWKLSWLSGSTEYQEVDWNCTARQVNPVEKTIIMYE